MADPLAPLNLRDDRGEALTQLGRFDKRDGLWHDRERPFLAMSVPLEKYWRAAIYALWPYVPYVLLGLYAFWWWGTSRGTRPPPSLGVFLVWILLVGTHEGFRSWWARRPDGHRARELWVPIAWLCAHRVCGVCGYEMKEIEPGADGIAVCPECGAAWHRDRWTMAGNNPRANDELVGLIEGRPLARVGMSDVDDRGVPAAIARGFYPRWMNDARVPADVRDDLRARIRAVGARRARLFNVFGLPIWLGVVAFMMWSADPLPRDRWATLQVFTLTTGLFYLVLMYVAVRAGIGKGRIKRESLNLGRCPNCGEGLGSGVVGFDGCEACARCGRAWKHAEIGSMPGSFLPDATSRQAS
ncbi:MAG: hypothetical protein AABZ53_06545 [Planctomycetota bacterium]